MKRSSLVVIDNLFLPFYFLINGLKRFLPKKQKKTEQIIILKFFGLGSITRIASVIRDSDTHSHITFVTLERNKAIVDLLNLEAIYINDKNPVILLGSLVKKLFRIWRKSNASLVDMERSSNLAGIYGLLCSIGKNYSKFHLKSTNKQKKNYRYVSLLNKSALTAIGEILRVDYSPKNTENKKTSHIQKIGININAGDYLPERRFPLEKWRELFGSLIHSYPGVTFYFTGVKKEARRVEEFCQSIKDLSLDTEVINLAGVQTLDTFISSLKNFDLFFTNDSGPLHLAHYFDVKTVAIWGPTAPELVGYPNTDQMLNLVEKLPCSHCFVHPKSEVAKDCGGELTCFNEMKTEKLLDKIKEFTEV